MGIYPLGGAWDHTAMHSVMRIVFPVALIAGAVQLSSQETPSQSVDFQAQVQPILAKHCQGCHGGATPVAKLRLDTAAGLAETVKAGKITPGKSAESLLVRRITDTNGAQMPPSGNPLSAAEVGVIRAWIDQGAHLPTVPQDLFTTKVQPLFARSCYSCHSGNEPKGRLNLSVKALALKGGALGGDIVPGKSGDSRMIHRVLGDPGAAQMPLGGKALSAEDVATLRQWIDSGAEWPDTAVAQMAPAAKHWAYNKPVRPKLPEVKDTAWVRNPIDNFVLVRLENEGLKPSKEAAKETLIRRVSLDLTGLPPSPAEVDEFLADKRTDAYERLVDRLLASPRYGERWATPWLDLARYGDSEGWTNDRQREAWPYRDWVIKALNNNMPFDQFTVEQLAGDLLPNPTIDQKIATGFVRASMLQSEGGSDPAENNWNMQVDRASTVGTVFMGSSIACAQCHDHKYDPFTQKQFYQMVAFFNNSKFVDGSDPNVKKLPDARLLSFTEPVITLPAPEQAKKRDTINAEMSDYLKQINDSSPEFYKRQRDWEAQVKSAAKDWKALQPTRIVSAGGATLTLKPDNTILASGKNPDGDIYRLEAPAPAAQVTGIRVEAIPDLSLPAGGPGRDYYGNFMLRSMMIEAGVPGQKFRKIDIKDSISDIPPPQIINAAGKGKQLWIVDATHQNDGKVKKYAEKAARGELGATGPEGRIPMQLLLVPSKPFQLAKDEILRITIDQTSDVAGVNMGNFRLSVTDSASPKTIVDIPAALRATLNLDPDSRTPEQAKQLTAHYRTVAAELAPAREKVAELQERISDLHIPQALVLAEDTKVEHPSTYVHMRGAFVAKGDLVQADVPSFLGSIPPDAPPNRLGLARWLVSRDNPLTPRHRGNHGRLRQAGNCAIALRTA
jgi:mono/diheme cytochrome c family protein